MHTPLYRLVLATLLACLMTPLYAQTGPRGNSTLLQRHTLTFEALHGETYTVFLDGAPANRMPQSRVVVSDASSMLHEVVVVLRQPTAKAAVLRLMPAEATVTVQVSYDAATGQLLLYTPAQNRADSYADAPRPTAAATAHTATTTPAAESPAERLPVSQDELNAMALRMQAVPFDTERLALGKVLVASSALTATQIATLGRTLDISRTKIDFLKYAYPYCADPAHYADAVSILPYSSDRKKVLDYIATQP